MLVNPCVTGENSMSYRKPPLSETYIDNIQPGEKPLKLFDGGGLFLLVKPSGSRQWRLKYRFDGKEKMISFGIYPGVSLSDARLQRSEARLLLDQGIDPSTVRKEEKAQLKASESAAFNEHPSVRLIMDGTVEIWKGRSVLRFKSEEANFIKNLLNKLL
jgi:hypothetical protein